MKAKTDKVSKDDIYNRISMILVDKGMDIKMGNKDIGLITTEYKQVGAFGKEPPFDMYLQIKASIKETPDNKVMITLIPLVKDVNRLNAAAFNERQLRLVEEKDLKGWGDRAFLETCVKAQLLFMNVAQALAEQLGMDISQFEQSVQLVNK
jgi:hypothetical protein